MTVTVVSAVAALWTVAMVVAGGWMKDQDDKFAFFCVYAFWTFTPPLWFFVEYVWLFDSLRGNPLRVQDLNTSQGLAQKIWAALLAFLGVFALLQ